MSSVSEKLLEDEISGSSGRARRLPRLQGRDRSASGGRTSTPTLGLDTA